MSDIPILDLALPDDELATLMRLAARQHGFFVATNHGVPDKIITNTYKHAKAFFALSNTEKLTVLANNASRGYTPFMEETLDPTNQAKGDTKEGYYIGREISAEEVEGHAHPLQGENVWPDEDTLCLPGWKDAMKSYFSEVHGVGMRLLRLLALSLSLPAHHFDEFFSRPMEMLRLLRYGPDVSAPDDGVFGCGAHTDYGMLTLLSTDEVPGLEVYLEDSKTWLRVAPRPNDFIVNFGDMLERWTNKKYPSTLHRVVNRSGRERFSIPFFFEPNFETNVECLPGILENDEVPLFPPITSGQHLIAKYKETHANYSKEK